MSKKIAYTIDDAAFEIGLSRSTLYDDMRAGKLPYLKRKRSRRILRSDLIAYAKRMRVVTDLTSASKQTKGELHDE